jgi:hypothetical protein
MSVREKDERCAVDPARLDAGTWCHRAEKMLGEGDISCSYSADRIGMDQPVRKPFSWQGGLWVCVSIATRGGELSAEAYRLMHPQVYDGQTFSYRERVQNGHQGRADPDGFYHGMRVRRAGSEFILCGPPVIFVPGEQEQMHLF